MTASQQGKFCQVCEKEVIDFTKTTDAEKGGSIYAATGNDGYTKFGATVSTGKSENGLAATVSASRTVGDGYVDGTEFIGYNYFVNIAKEFGEEGGFKTPDAKEQAKNALRGGRAALKGMGDRIPKGFGGEKMVKEGLVSIFPMSEISMMGIIEIFHKYHIYKVFHKYHIHKLFHQCEFSYVALNYLIP